MTGEQELKTDTQLHHASVDAKIVHERVDVELAVDVYVTSGR